MASQITSASSFNSLFRLTTKIPRYQDSWGQHGAHLRTTGPRWAPYWPHEPSIWVHQSSILLVLCGGIHIGWPGDSFHKGPVMWKTFSCHNIIMTSRLFVACDSKVTRSEATDQGGQFDDSVCWSQCHVALLYKTRCRQKLLIKIMLSPCAHHTWVSSHRVIVACWHSCLGPYFGLSLVSIQRQSF